MRGSAAVCGSLRSGMGSVWRALDTKPNRFIN